MPQTVRYLLGPLLLALVCWLDTITDPAYNLAAFYLIPIAYAAWFYPRFWAYAVAITASSMWLYHSVIFNETLIWSMMSFANLVTILGHPATFMAVSIIVVRLRKLTLVEHEMSQFKSRVLSLASHEFRNTLTTIDMATRMLKETEPAAEQNRSRLYTTLERSATELQRAVHNFLNLTRFEGGRFKPRILPVNIGTLIENTSLLFQPLLAEKRIRFQLDMPVSVSVKGDADALRIVMSNLISNAIKYTPEGGNITARVSLEKSRGARARIEVKDTGIGISSNDRRRIISAFYRESSGRRAADGYGIGLAISQELLEAQDSSLCFTSRVGKGTRFYFYLPVFYFPLIKRETAYPIRLADSPPRTNLPKAP